MFAIFWILTKKGVFMNWKKEYENRLVTVEEAIKNIHDGDKVVMSFGCGEPRAIVRAMRENYKNYNNVEIINNHQEKPEAWCLAIPHLRRGGTPQGWSLRVVGYIP